ncbi:O-antigen/teichoic acid export membrane protein [Variovorax sp. W1I1]|uniref:oligosaccharide flippase family protein n=1 Tax=Variovorax sp. W1I1 TaxID=3042309 RepID=UPI00278A349F|nr:oligosaccharide flippase family protein [Variovorax sp. W1I1]MDQ0606597.1 O-antigen/teichoic acid export membrane protein [Variovorax sp. W1I1]
MSLKRNILASYATQIYVTLIGILILPMYLKYMGAEAYGLVGFFTMLQAWFNLLDLGLTPTVARETARFRGGALDALSYRRLLRALQVIFLAIAIFGAVLMFGFSGLIANRWLNAQTLPLAEIQLCLQLMAGGVALRWMSGFYRGCISGSERLVWLGGFNAFVATLRFVGVLPVLILIGPSPTIFFSYQLLVALIELFGLVAKSQSLFPAIQPDQIIGWSIRSLFIPIRSVLQFSLTIAFTTSAWVLVTQTDKLVLSKFLPLVEYGYFTLAVLAASGVTMVGGPISSALMPRMARLQAEGDEAGLLHLYRKATQIVAVIAIPASLVLAFFAEQVLWVWTGDAIAAAQAAPVLRLYALGNGFLAIAAFPYYLQFAKGDLVLHVRANVMYILLLLPTLIWATWVHGAKGAGYTWLILNALYFFVVPLLVHRRFHKGLHRLWLGKDLLPIFFACSLSAWMLSFFSFSSHSRFFEFLQLISLGLGTFIFGVIAIFLARTARKIIAKKMIDRVKAV